MDGPNLSKSPFELGISRADLWAFAGILALDEAQRTTRSQCDNYNYDRDHPYITSAKGLGWVKVGQKWVGSEIWQFC